jgi:ribosome-associated protein
MSEGEMMEFELNGHEYIELNKLLKFLRYAESGGEANLIIDNGDVMVNDEIETRRRKKLRAGDLVKYQQVFISIK